MIEFITSVIVVLDTVEHEIDIRGLDTLDKVEAFDVACMCLELSGYDTTNAIVKEYIFS